MRALLDSRAPQASYEEPVIWPVLSRQSRRTVGSYCVKLGIPLGGGVAAIEHKEDAGACRLQLRRGAGPAAFVALAAAESSAKATLSVEDGRGLLDVR